MANHALSMVLLSDKSVGMGTGRTSTGYETIWESWTVTVNSGRFDRKVCKGVRDRYGDTQAYYYAPFRICMARSGGWP
jgi:hypothetical protein